jgi:hypothetical protein
MTAQSEYERESASVRETTIGQLLDMLHQRTPLRSMRLIEKALGVVLNEAAATHDGNNDSINELALNLGLIAVRGLDKDSAAHMVATMGALAHFTLKREDWSPDTVARLKVIRDTNPDLPEWDWELKTNGMIFEFKELETAKAFADAVKKRFHLDGRVFDDAKAAERAHKYPFVQHPPVAHIDRPWWKLDRHAYPSEQEFNKAWDKAWKIERQVEKLAQKFGGKFVGT